MMSEKIKNSNEMEFAVFCIENVAAKLGVEVSAFISKTHMEKTSVMTANPILLQKKYSRVIEHFAKHQISADKSR